MNRGSGDAHQTDRTAHLAALSVTVDRVVVTNVSTRSGPGQLTDLLQLQLRRVLEREIGLGELHDAVVPVVEIPNVQAPDSDSQLAALIAAGVIGAIRRAR